MRGRSLWFGCLVGSPCDTTYESARTAGSDGTPDEIRNERENAIFWMGQDDREMKIEKAVRAALSLSAGRSGHACGQDTVVT